MQLRAALTLLVAMLLCLAARLPVHGQSGEVINSGADRAPRRPMPAFTDTPQLSEDNALPEPAMQGVSPQNSIVGADSDNTTPTAWWVYTGQTGTQVSNLISNLGARIIDLHVDSTAPTFTVTMVAESGSYNKGWWWYYGITASQLNSYLTTNNARPISLKAYVVNGTTYFAVVMISNTGTDAKAYWWYYGESVSGISSLLNSKSARLVTVDPYTSGSSTLYTAVMIANSGSDASAWWWYVNASPSSISTAVNNNKARIFYMSAGSSGTFNVIMESCSNGCPEWWWYYGQTGSALLNRAVQNGARLVNTTIYPGCGGTCFAGPMINNSNALTTRVGNIIRQNGVGGTQGLYLKRVNGGVLANLEDGFVYEPASAIKVVNNLYAMNQARLGNIHMATPITRYINGPDSCPLPQDASGTEPLDLAVREMMWHSDNARTAEIDDWFGFSNVNNYAASIGMTNTKFNGYVGCASQPRNTFTLDDASTLYEGVAKQSLLPQSWEGVFHSSMAGKAEYLSEGYDFTGVWDNDIPNLINAVAPAGTTAAQKTAYMNAMNVAYKAGGYVFCTSDCTHIVEDVDIAGWFQLPICNANGTVTFAQYTWGIFFSNAPDNSWFNGKNTIADQNFTAAKSELMREQIKAGMNSCAGKSLNVLTYTPAGLTFSSQTVGTTSPSQTITVTNNQLTDATGFGISSFGEFVQSNNCTSTLAAGASCTITVKFHPAGTGMRTGAVIISSNAAGKPQTIELTGTGS